MNNERVGFIELRIEFLDTFVKTWTSSKKIP